MTSRPPPQIAPPIGADELERTHSRPATPPDTIAEHADGFADAVPAMPTTQAPLDATTEQPGIVPALLDADRPARPAAEPIELNFPSRRTLARWLLVLLALYAVGWLLWNALPALTPFIIGLVLAYLLLPLVNRLDRWMPRGFAILTVYAGAIVLVTVAARAVHRVSRRPVPRARQRPMPSDWWRAGELRNRSVSRREKPRPTGSRQQDPGSSATAARDPCPDTCAAPVRARSG